MKLKTPAHQIHPKLIEEDKVDNNATLNTCNNKIGYKSENKAYKVLFHRLKKTLGLRVYKCPICFMWHLTKQPLKLSEKPNE